MGEDILIYSNVLVKNSFLTIRYIILNQLKDRGFTFDTVTVMF